MNRSTMSLLYSAVLASLVGCAKAPPPLPAASPEVEQPLATLVWIGTGSAYRMRDGRRERTEANDYVFTVTQRRYRSHWESVKELHRRHPDYDGSAGPRDQSYLFRLALGPVDRDSVRFQVRATLGNGVGVSDTLFRRATLEFVATGASKFAPFNTYRISQQYGYEQGELRETVSLFKRSARRVDVPFVEIDESARLFVPGAYNAPPTSVSGVTRAP